MPPRDLLLLWGRLQPSTEALFSRLSQHWRLTIVSPHVPAVPPWAGELHHPDAVPGLLRKRWSGAMTASWNITAYMQAARRLRIAGTPILAAMDNPWRGTLRQRCACLLARGWLRNRISNLVCSGSRQAEFAGRLGYPDPLRGYACASRRDTPTTAKERRFIFVGRLLWWKGVRELIAGYELYRADRRDKAWPLIVIGDGPLAEAVRGRPGVTWLGGLPHAQVLAELDRSTALVFPSSGDHWGTVVQEAAQAGCWLIVGEGTGSHPDYVQDGVNGRVVATRARAIADALIEADGLAPAALAAGAVTSFGLGNRMTAETAAEQIDGFFTHG